MSPLRETLRQDLVGGLTVALVGLPQCLAYAMMAGLPPAYGLATAAVPGFIAALVGQSPQVVTGPTNTTGLLILVALSPYLDPSGVLAVGALPVLATLTLLVGALRLIAAGVGAATLVDFLPESVLVGFTTGAGVLIAAMQLDEALGIASTRAPHLIALGIAWSERLSAGDWPQLPAVIVTVVTAASIAVGRRFRPNWPVALVVVAVASIATAAFGWGGSIGLPLVSERSAVPNGWPRGALPTVDPQVVLHLLAPAAAITLVGTLELVVTARAGGARPNLRREIAAQGAANAVGAFTSAFPASASLTRSALLRLGGAQTRWAAAFAAVATVPILLSGSRLVAAIPLASLAGVLMVIAAGMIQVRRVKRMWAAGGMTRLLLAITLIGTLTLPLPWAILGGAGLALVVHLLRTTRPRIQLLCFDGQRLRAPQPDELLDHAILEVSGDLHFAATRHFLDEARAKLPPSAKLVVLDLTHAHEVRFAALLACEQLRRELAKQGIDLALAGISPELSDMLERAGSKLVAFPYHPTPGSSAVEAVAQLRASAPPHPLPPESSVLEA